jgi:predicted methyltransferase
LAEFLGDIVEKRPAADVTLDQTKATRETLAKRILYLDRHDAIAGRRVLCLGDDDFVAVAATRWVDWVARAGRDGGPRRLTVMDVDPRICSAISALAPQVETLAHDLRNPLPEDCRRAFDVIVTDPPYTPQGAELFLSRAAEAAAAEGAHCFFSFGHLDPTAMLAVQSTISRIGWVVVEWLPAFNQYEGSSVLAGVSLMAHLVASDSIAPTLTGAYEGALYTGDLRPMIRTYRCVGCCAEWEVGPGKHWPTVQDLKSEHCPLCGCERFTRRGQRPAEIA